MKIKCTETLEYEVEVPDGLTDTQIRKRIWSMEDIIYHCYEMTTPPWDGFSTPQLTGCSFKWSKDG